MEKSEKHWNKMEIITLFVGALLLVLMITSISLAFVLKDLTEDMTAQSQKIYDDEQEIHVMLETIGKRDARIAELEQMISDGNHQMDQKVIDLEAKVKELTELNENLYEDNKNLIAAQDKWDEQLAEVKERLDVYETYDYAMFDTEGKRNDMNYDYIKELTELTAYRPVNDIDLYLSWIMIECEGHSNCRNKTSTAKGFAQFLDGTGKSVYNKYLADKYEIEYYPDIVIDRPDICIDMMQEYVNYLYEETHDLNKTIDCYRGLHDEPYLRLFNKYLANNGKSIDSIATATKERELELLKAVG